jgi:predicted PurR-regulated permease PerM
MSEVKLPFYLKATTILFGLFLFGYLVYVGSDILVPLGFSFLIAILLHPLVVRFERWKISRVFSIIIAIIIAFIVFGGIIYFIASQFANFAEALPQLKARFVELAAQLQLWLDNKMGISTAKQTQWLNDGLNSSGKMLGSTLGAFTGVLVLIFLIPVYVFLLLFYRPLLVNFFQEVFSGTNDKETIGEVLKETKQVIQSYMTGILIESGIVMVLNSTALLIIGVDYAIVLGVIGGLLNMIPYIGGVIAIALPVIMSLISETSFTPVIAIICSYAVIQFVDNNYLVPKIVASKVRINAIISILAVLIGGALAGTAGMFLSLPTVAIFKIVFDRVESLKPWGRLLGDEMPGENKPDLNDQKMTIAKDDAEGEIKTK